MYTLQEKDSSVKKFSPWGLKMTDNAWKIYYKQQGKFKDRYSHSHYGKCTPTSVRRRSYRVDFRLRNPSSPDVVFVMKALFSILDPQNRVETNTCFVFAHDFVLAVRYLLFFFVAYLYYRFHKISAMPPFHGWPITTTTLTDVVVCFFYEVSIPTTPKMHY